MKKETRKHIKESNNEYLLESLAERDQLHAIKALGDTEGGGELVRLFARDIIGVMHKLMRQSDDLTHIQIIACCKEMKICYDTARLLVNAKDSLEALDAQIEETLLQ